MDGFWFGCFENLSCVVPLLTYITEKCQLRYNKVPEWWPSKESMDRLQNKSFRYQEQRVADLKK